MDAVEHRADIVAGLRALADLFENEERLPVPEYVTVQQSVMQLDKNWKFDHEASKREIKKIVRALGRGRKEKEFNSYEFRVTKKLSERVKVVYSVTREAVCKKVPTGETIIYAAQVIPERKEEKFEWVCEDAVLTAKDV